ncbi:hypothetical protein ACFFX0_25615 [Citricoccus parietis]|uniref:Uncharacterized protein n=1 Tax=Citricoccus parietis TaxID=592307 RepID=A0ABV5G615_9MICC
MRTSATSSGVRVPTRSSAMTGMRNGRTTSARRMLSRRSLRSMIVVPTVLFRMSR